MNNNQSFLARIPKREITAKQKHYILFYSTELKRLLVPYVEVSL